ncbi:hypothetical protein E1B28_002625 [Marasmius oreades]|uniref:Uncharacterized protein n=1 Tax=Marasmius oreades TaxID=181124 RepID=A0A9P7UKY9_9AGAR|nr:uncharacterized protein E1B28_002625 [Marasmius oreades]KAG7086687.1 hypothetical protein E1B28_002625 [Marasmius oreades]
MPVPIKASAKSDIRKESVDDIKSLQFRSKKEKERLINKVINQMMVNPSYVCLDELTILEDFRRALLRRVRNQQARTSNLKAFLQTLDVPIADPTLYAEVFNEDSEFIKVDNIEVVDAFETLVKEEDRLPIGSVIHRDIVETYQTELNPEERKKVVIVAGLSEGLCCVFPEVNGSTESVEAVIDGGSQIVAINAWVAQGVGLKWDPNSVIHMQSANGQIKSMLRLCRNVPFKFGDYNYM